MELTVQIQGVDRLVRSLDALVSERGRNVFFRLALRAIKDFALLQALSRGIGRRVEELQKRDESNGGRGPA